MYLTRLIICSALVMAALFTWRCTVAKQAQDIDRRIVNGAPEDHEIRWSREVLPILDRMDRLEGTLGELKQQVGRLVELFVTNGAQRVLQDLEGLCEELHGSRQTQTTTPPNSFEAGASVTAASNASGQSHLCPHDPEATHLRATKVMQEETETSYLVTVCYDGPETPQVFASHEPYAVMEEVTAVRAGTVTVVVIKTAGDDDAADPGVGPLRLELRLPQHSVLLWLQLAPRGMRRGAGTKKPPQHRDVRLPYIRVSMEPGSDVTYAPGSDVDFQVEVDMEYGENLIENQDGSMELWLKTRSEDIVVKTYRLSPHNPLPEQLSDIQLTAKEALTPAMTAYGGLARRRTVGLHMPYSAEREWGFLLTQEMVYINCSGACLVYAYADIQYRAFYPRGQASPLSDGFLGFASGHGDSENRECFLGERQRWCRLTCVVVGDQPSVSLRKTDSPPPSLHVETSVFIGFITKTSWRFANVTQSDAGGYVCQAFSRHDGYVISRELTLSITWPAEIVDDRTDVEVLQNGTLMVVCIAQGIPIPTVRFGPYLSGNDTNHIFDDADVMVTHLDNVTSQATLLIPEWRNYSDYEIDDMYCFAENSDNLPAVGFVWRSRDWHNL